MPGNSTETFPYTQVLKLLVSSLVSYRPEEIRNASVAEITIIEIAYIK